MKFIDISRDLLTSEVWPGDPEPRLQLVNRMDCGDDFNLSAVYASLHTGTHADAPLHVFEEGEGETIDEIPLEKFIGPVTVLTLPKGPITGEMVERIFPKGVSKLILRTNEDSEFFAGASADVAALHYELLGFDRLSIGGEDEIGMHRNILGAGTVLLENLDLSAVPEDGEYFLVAQPVKICGREASFVRAVLIDDYIFWSTKK